MRVLGIVIYWIGNVLLYGAAAVIAASILYGWYQNGFGWVQDTLSPFNVWNWLATVIVLAPGIGLITLGKKFKAKAERDKLT